MKPTGAPSSPALANMAFPTSFVICNDTEIITPHDKMPID